MKVLYDYQAFDIQKHGGVTRYFFELISYLEENKQVNWALPIKFTDNEYLSRLPLFQGKLIPSSTYFKDFLFGLDFKGKRKLYNLRNKYYPGKDVSLYNKNLSLKSLKEGRYTIFHPTLYGDYFLPYLGKKPLVLTVHDMIHELYPQYFRHTTLAARKKILVEKASKIIAVSQNTKKDLINILNVPEEKIEVIYHGNSIKNSASNPSLVEKKLPQTYLLHVGSRDKYKNFYPFLQSIRDLLLKDKSLHIICTGLAFSREERKLFASLKVEHQLIHYQADDMLLSGLYKNARALVFPSLYEGFGIPVLEAFNCGCPCLLSDSSSLPEIGGKAAVYFDPENRDSIQAAVTKVMNDAQLREDLIKLGYEQAKKFSWETMATQTCTLYGNIR